MLKSINYDVKVTKFVLLKLRKNIYYFRNKKKCESKSYNFRIK